MLLLPLLPLLQITVRIVAVGGPNPPFPGSLLPLPGVLAALVFLDRLVGTFAHEEPVLRDLRDLLRSDRGQQQLLVLLVLASRLRPGRNTTHDEHPIQFLPPRCRQTTNHNFKKKIEVKYLSFFVFDFFCFFFCFFIFFFFRFLDSFSDSSDSEDESEELSEELELSLASEEAFSFFFFSTFFTVRRKRRRISDTHWGGMGGGRQKKKWKVVILKRWCV